MHVQFLCCPINESFFSDLTRFDRESHRYPKACNIPHVMGQVVTLNYLKHKPDKGFDLCATMKGTYPVHLLDDDWHRINHENFSDHKGLYRDHFFDMINPNKIFYRCHKDDVSKNKAPMQCVPGMRRFYRTNEQETLAEHCAGYEPKGFDKLYEKN